MGASASTGDEPNAISAARAQQARHHGSRCYKIIDMLTLCVSAEHDDPALRESFQALAMCHDPIF